MTWAAARVNAGLSQIEVGERLGFSAQHTGHISTNTDLIPVHTAWVRDGLTWEEYMELAQDLLSLCDMVCVLPGHRKSKGARIEVRLAKDAGMPVIDLDKVVEEFGR